MRRCCRPFFEEYFAMTSRACFLIAAAAATAFAAASLPARAAMPVGSTQPSVNSDLKLVQDQAAAAATQKKSGTKKSKRQKEIDSSVESGTVPKRYQTNVPKEYHHLIPWAK
jgi:hypothetical protein